MRKAAIVISMFMMSGLISLSVEAYMRIRSAAASSSQDPIYLDRRISLLEQRVSMMESNVNRLQQQAMTTIPSTQPARNPELELLRSEVDILKSHLREVSCGLARLDERTLSSEAREAQKRSSATKDPCRQFPDAPIQLTPIR